MTQKITSENFEELIASGKPIVLDFWATWCDIEEDEDLPMRFGVRNIPTILFIKNGEVVDKQVGAAARPVFEEKLKSIL